MNEPARARGAVKLALVLMLAALVALSLLLVSDLPSHWLGSMEGFGARWFGAPPASIFHAREVSKEGLGGPFTLLDAHNRPRSLDEFRGKVVVLTFGYTNCPDFCPTTLAKLAEARRMLGSDGTRVQVLFVTIDPARDSAQLLDHYVPSFDPSFLGLRGTQAQTEAVTRSFHANFQIVQDQGQTLVDHTASSYVIDAQGQTRLVSPYEQTARSLAEDLTVLLRVG